MKNKSDFLEDYILFEGENKQEKSSNLYINDNGELINYYTRIAYFKDGDLYLNITKYSQTTSVNQNKLIALANKYGINVIKYEA